MAIKYANACILRQSKSDVDWQVTISKTLVEVAFVSHIDSKAFAAFLKPLGICLSGKQKGIAYLWARSFTQLKNVLQNRH